MSNPDNALGTNGAYGGRTSVNAFNDVLATFSGRGVLSGWECVPDTGLTVNIGGNGTDRDVALAEDNVGNKTTVNNISQAPVPVTMPAAPATNSRVDAIVAYIEASPSATAETDNYTAVNLLVVSGTASATPTVPNDSDIRTAITGDGASGSTAYYVILATVTIPSGTTDIDATMITAGTPAQLTSKNIDFVTYQPVVAGQETEVGTWVDGKTIYARYFTGTYANPSGGTVTNVTLLPFGSVETIVRIEGMWAPDYSNPRSGRAYAIGSYLNAAGTNTLEAYFAIVVGSNKDLRAVGSSYAYSGRTGSFAIVVYYTKP